MTWEQAVIWLRHQPDKEDLVRASYFDDPLIQAAKRFAASDEWVETLGRLPVLKSGLALDLGAGRGITSFALAEAGWTVVAVEPDPSSLVGAGAIRALAAQSSLPIQVVEEFGEDLPFPDNHFDLVYGRQVLHHARELPQLCRQVFRVMKPSAVFAATREHVIDNRGKSLEAFLARHLLHPLYGGENAFTLREYCEAILGSGFKCLTQLGPYETAINFSEPSRRQQEEKYRQALARISGRFFSELVWRYAFVRRPAIALASQTMNRFSRYPGRLFSFFAVKPGN